MKKMQWTSLALAACLMGAFIGCQGNRPAGPTEDAQPAPGATSADARDNGSRVSPRASERQAAPRAVIRTVPAGITIPLELVDTVASNRNHPGDRIEARVPRDIVVGGSVVIPAGSVVSGVVTEAAHLRKIGGRAKLRLEFSTIDPPAGPPAPMQASYFAMGKSETKKDAATIGGAAIGGAVLGRIIGHDKGNEARGTAIGGAVGAATGTAIAASTKGQEIVLPAGRAIRVTLKTPVQLTVQG